MGFRQIYISSASKLSVSDKQLVINRLNADPLFFPIEDLDVVFLEDPNAVVSTRLMTELSKSGVSLIVCGSDYLPSAITIPFDGYYKQTENLKRQIALLPSKRNKMWETIIKAKIRNQAKVIECTTQDERAHDTLLDYINNVKFGDENNMEGSAARVYFRSLFGPTFIRFGDTPISSALNYGYSIITGAVIRSCAFSGLNGSLGIWHDNVLNANNLACDLVEPFRPIVDYYVFKNMASLTLPLSKEFRRGLIDLLNSYVLVDRRKYQVSYAISLLVNNYVEYLESGDISCVHPPEFFHRGSGDVEQDE